MFRNIREIREVKGNSLFGKIASKVKNRYLCQ